MFRQCPAPANVYHSAMRFAVDTGGTFTDLVVEDETRQLHMVKAPTTPEDPVRGVMDALAVAAADLTSEVTTLLRRCDLFLYATTLATNAILTGRAARTAFVTTRGHRDILLFREAGRFGIPTFDWSVPYPEPIVPRALTFEVSERIGAAGEVVTPLDEEDAARTVEAIAAAGVEAVGVCFLWSIANPAHELRLGELLAARLPGLAVTLSHVLNPSLREYRRASSACLDAALKPLMGGHLDDLARRLGEAGFAGRLMVANSQGGVMEAADAARAPIHCIKSGPAMAPVAGRFFAKTECGADTAIVADAGGTSFDVSLVRRGRIPWTRETCIGPRREGRISGFPSVDARSVGAGGGSIAWVDEGGLLHVGPDSAGAAPGPACYARGGDRPTVTDAALALGYLDPARFLGGRMGLDAAAAEKALQAHVADPLGLDAATAAAAVLALVTEAMVGAIEDVTINQGIDPRLATLVAGGGASGLNAVAIARRLGCPRVLVPPVAPALSAAGALYSDLSAEVSALHATATGGFDHAGVDRVLAGLERRCRDFIDGPGQGNVGSVIEYSVEARYAHQVWEIEVPLQASRVSGAVDLERLVADFHAAHRDIFAIDDPGSEVEMIAWRARVRCPLGAPKVAATAASGPRNTEHRAVRFPGGDAVEAQVLSFAALGPDEAVAGPAIIESALTTVVVDPGATVRRCEAAGLVITP